jgi:hypothetical protein
MARAASLPTLGLTPFGGGGSSFDAFSVGQKKAERAYLEFRKVEVEWEAGRVSNDAFLAALRTYAASMKAGSADRVGAEARVEQYVYRFERQALEAAAEAGTKTWDDLLAYDQSKLAGLDVNSEEYLQRLGYVQSDQNQIFNDLEEAQGELYSDGKITTAQYLLWYQSVRPDLLKDNKELSDAIALRIDDLKDRAINEQDNKMLSDFSDGKVAPTEFLAYASAAQGRYAKGTPQFDEWGDRVEDAKDRAIEDSILYRYDLTQRYQQLEKFVKDNGSAPKGGTSTSHSTRVVWNGSKWVTQKTTSTKATKPSAAQLKAWKELQVEVADAKKQMKQIEATVGKQAGGWVTTDDTIAYYKKMQSRYAVGTSEWYAVQGKLDGLNQQKHAEEVMRKQGVRISYPKVASEQKEYGSGGAGVWGTTAEPGSAAAAGSATAAAATPSAAPAATKAVQSGDRDISVDEFMRAIAKVESGGRYDARNKNSGAYGKYQIMPANWPGWAQKFLGDRNAKPTPENQEKVARGKFLALYKWLGDWRAVAHWWLTGGSDKNTHRTPGQWSSSSTRYVNKVFGNLGMSPTEVRAGPVTRDKSGGTALTAGASGGGGASGGPRLAASPSPSTTGGKATGGKAKQEAEGPGGDVVDRLPAKVDGMRNPLNFPKGYDGRAYENFYDAYMRAWQNGEESFTDYSTGKAVTYFVPLDAVTRVALADELDDRRVDYYVEKAKAYLNPDGSPTASSIAAIDQANGAIKDAAENHLFGLSFDEEYSDKRNPALTTKTNLNVATRRAEAKDYEETAKAGTVDVGNPKAAATTVNPLAKGVKLAAQLDTQLDQLAGAAERAMKNGDFEMAYAINQKAISLVATTKPILDLYIQNASAQIRGSQQAGAVVPGVVSEDWTELNDQYKELGKAGKGTLGKGNMDPSLKRLEEVQAQLVKYIKFDKDGEPVTRAGAGGGSDRSFVLNDNVQLIWKNGQLETDLAASNVGWDSPTSQSKGKPMVQLFGVKVGSSVKGNVQTEYKSGVVGFIGGNENYPVYGKIVTGVDANGKPFMWGENPLTGGWYSIKNSPLTIKAPKGFKGVMSESGGKRTATTPMDFEFQSGGQSYRMVYDPADSTYALWAPSKNVMGAAEWEPVGKVGGGKNDDLKAIINGAGWAVDTANRVGDDRKFVGMTGPVVGMSGTEWQSYLDNTTARYKRGSPKAYEIEEGRRTLGAKPVAAPSMTAGGVASVIHGKQWEEDAYQAKLKDLSGAFVRPAADPAGTSAMAARLRAADAAKAQRDAAAAKERAYPAMLEDLATTFKPAAKPVAAKRAAPVKRKTPSKGVRRKVAPPPKPKPAPKPTYGTAKLKTLETV